MALLLGPCHAGTPGVCTAWRWGALAPCAGIPPLPAPSPTGWPGKPAVGMLANRRGQLRTSENSGKGEGFSELCAQRLLCVLGATVPAGRGGPNPCVGREGRVLQAGSSPCCEDRSPAGKRHVEEFASGQGRCWLGRRGSTVLGLSCPIQQGEAVRGAQEVPHSRSWLFPDPLCTA